MTVGSTDETAVSITDDDAPEVTVSFEESSYAVAEGNSVTVAVKLDVDPERTVTIPLTKSNQSGASAGDYSVPSSVVFNSGDTEKTFGFSATQDTVDDDGESVKLGFGSSLPVGVTAGTPSEATVSITDDDVPSVTVSFEESSYTVAEGSSEAVKVKLSADPERTVEVPISATDMDGASSSDYSIVPQTVVFNSGDTEKTFSFSATDDTEDDDGERVRLNFGTLPPRVSSTSPSQAVVSITDDDVPSVTVSFEESSYTVAEGNSVTVKVKLSADPERTVTIPLTKSNQGGASNSDYSNVPANVVFNSGDTEKSFTFSATQDTENDDGESVKLGFQNLPTGVSAGSTNESTVSITDDDVPSVTVSFEESSYAVGEGDSVAVKVVLSADPERRVAIPLAKTNQGGASASDYSVPSSVVFNSGDTAKTFTFSANADDVDDDGERVSLGFQNLPAGVSAGTTDETTVSITDNDTAGVTVSETSLDIDEGDSDTYTVVLDSQPTHSVTITVNDPSNTDVTADPADLTFTTVNWDTAQTVTVTVAQDNGHDDEDGTVTHTAASTDTKYAGISIGSVLVNVTDDDDVPVTVSFGSATYTVAEGDTVEVKVKLSADPEENCGGAHNGHHHGRGFSRRLFGSARKRRVQQRRHRRDV